MLSKMSNMLERMKLTSQGGESFEDIDSDGSPWRSQPNRAIEDAMDILSFALYDENSNIVFIKAKATANNSPGRSTKLCLMRGVPITLSKYSSGIKQWTSGVFRHEYGVLLLLMLTIWRLTTLRVMVSRSHRSGFEEYERQRSSHDSGWMRPHHGCCKHSRCKRFIDSRANHY